MQELVQRGEQVICYNAQEFQSPVERSGAIFRAYSSTDFSSSELARVLQDGNLANATRLILCSTEQLLPFVLDELRREKPDLVVFDSIALWGKMAAARLGLRAAASISHLVMDEKHMGPLDLLKMLAKYQGARDSKAPLPDPALWEGLSDGERSFLCDRLNIVFTTRDLQPDTPILDETSLCWSIHQSANATKISLLTLEGFACCLYLFGHRYSAQPDFYQAC
jgi:hypothetical protein